MNAVCPFQNGARRYFGVNAEWIRVDVGLARGVCFLLWGEPGLRSVGLGLFGLGGVSLALGGVSLALGGLVRAGLRLCWVGCGLGSVGCFFLRRESCPDTRAIPSLNSKLLG